MPQLILRQSDAKVVRQLKKRAGEHGVSMEEEHRRILRQTLLGTGEQRVSFKDYLRQMPNLGPDDFFKRDRDLGREAGPIHA